MRWIPFAAEMEFPAVGTSLVYALDRNAPYTAYFTRHRPWLQLNQMRD